MNEIILKNANVEIKRFFALDTKTYQEGVLPAKVKEMLGLVASLVLRCNDCISYHILQCNKLGVTKEEVYEILKVHSHPGGFCLLMGEPGTGKTIIKESIKQNANKRMVIVPVARSIHTYINTVRILCQAFNIDFTRKRLRLNEVNNILHHQKNEKYAMFLWQKIKPANWLIKSSLGACFSLRVSNRGYYIEARLSRQNFKNL